MGRFNLSRSMWIFLFLFTTAWAESSVKFGLSQNQFAGEPQVSSQVQNDQNWSLGVTGKQQEAGWSSGTELVGFGSFQDSIDQYVGVPELYFKIKNKSNVIEERNWSLTIGRERRLWSRLDDQLSLGVWQPALRWDAMRPVSQGLTGLFFDLPMSSSWSLSLLTSPLFIPDQGPNFRVNDGRFESRNRWFRHPQSQLDLMGTTSAITYELEKPSVNDVIFQSSFAGSLRFEKNKFWSQASVAYMPSNQLHLGLGVHQTANESVIRVFPKTYRHSIFTLETGLKGEQQEGWLSFMTDRPQRPEFSQRTDAISGWEESELSNKNYVGASYLRKLPHFWGVGQNMQITLLRGWKNPLPRPTTTLMEQPVASSFDRPFYENLIALDWILAWKKYSKVHWESRLRYWQTVAPRSAWVSPSFAWIDGPWSYIASADLLGSEGDDDVALKSYFGQYRNNSRLLLGLSYVF